jgi:hypothetical protein
VEQVEIVEHRHSMDINIRASDEFVRRIEFEDAIDEIHDELDMYL